MIKFIPQAHAQINLGPITGAGKFQADPGKPALFEELVSTFLGIMTVAAGIAFIIYFLIGAFQWITSAGQQDKLQKAQKYITNGLTGLIIVILVYFAVGIIGQVLDIQILEPLKLLGL